MFWLFVVLGIIAIVIYNFSTELNKDESSLSDQRVHEKFTVVALVINDSAFGGNAQIVPMDLRNFKLYDENANQIVFFEFSTGTLRITWKYKYYQKEVVHERSFLDSRNLSLFEQQKIAETMIVEMRNVVAQHKANVLKG